MAASSESSDLTFTEAFPNYESAPRSKMSNFGVVVCRKIQDENYTGPNEWLAVDESKNRGWWLPAGYIDPGEPVSVGTARESIEEAGIDPNLLGILRIEVNVHNGRCRFVYFAEPRDPTQLPKDFVDKESNGAEFITIQKLVERSRKKLKHKLRGLELVHFGTVVDNGGLWSQPNFLCTTFDDTPENITWARHTGCQTGFIFKTVVVHNGAIYLTRNGELPESTVNGNERDNQLVQNWLAIQSDQYNYTILPESERVARVWHSMRDNGAYMGFLFLVRTENPPLELVRMEENIMVDEADSVLIDIAKTNDLWNLCILHPGGMKVVANPEPERFS